MSKIDKQPKNNRIDNLKGKGFKKGQSGNPNGRPKKEFCIPDIIRKQGKELDPTTKKTFYEGMVDKAWKLAVKGDKAARDWVSERTEGKALDRIEATINQEPIKVFDIE